MGAGPLDSDSNNTLYYTLRTTDGNGCRVMLCGSVCIEGYKVGTALSCETTIVRACSGADASLVHVPLIENRNCL